MSDEAMRRSAFEESLLSAVSRTRVVIPVDEQRVREIVRE